MHENFQFKVCTASACRAWPAHGRIQTESGRPVTPQLFSVEAARGFIQGGKADGDIDGDEAGALDKAARDSGLPEQETAEDRLFRHFQRRSAAELIGLRYGTIPGASDSGPTRIEKCTGACGHANCGRYPVHAHVFFKGIAKPVSSICFSHDWALKLIENGKARGVLTDTDEDALVDQLGSIPLEKRITRADKIANDVRWKHMPQMLAYALGAEELPEGTVPAIFSLCADDEGGMEEFRHGHMKVYGTKMGGWLFTSTKAFALLDELTENGCVTADDAKTVAAQIDSARLPKESKMQGDVDALIDLTFADVTIIDLLASR